MREDGLLRACPLGRGHGSAHLGQGRRRGIAGRATALRRAAGIGVDCGQGAELLLLLPALLGDERRLVGGPRAERVRRLKPPQGSVCPRRWWGLEVCQDGRGSGRHGDDAVTRWAGHCRRRQRFCFDVPIGLAGGELLKVDNQLQVTGRFIGLPDAALGDRDAGGDIGIYGGEAGAWWWYERASCFFRVSISEDEVLRTLPQPALLVCLKLLRVSTTTHMQMVVFIVLQMSE